MILLRGLEVGGQSPELSAWRSKRSTLLYCGGVSEKTKLEAEPSEVDCNDIGSRMALLLLSWARMRGQITVSKSSSHFKMMSSEAT